MYCWLKDDPLPAEGTVVSHLCLRQHLGKSAFYLRQLVGGALCHYQSGVTEVTNGENSLTQAAS